MTGVHTIWFKHLESQTLVENPDTILFSGGLFLDPLIPSSITTNFLKISSIDDSSELHSPISRRSRPIFRREKKSVRADFGGKFLCLSLSVKKSTGVVGNSSECLWSNGDESLKVEETSDGNGDARKRNIGLRGRGAVNTSKHLWAGAVAAMVSRLVLFSCTSLIDFFTVVFPFRKYFDLLPLSRL